MTVGERKIRTPGEGYDKHPMHEFAEQFVNITESLLEGGMDLYGNVSRAITRPDSYEQLKDYFIENSYDPKYFEKNPEGLEEHVQDMTALFENDREGMMDCMMENATLNTYNPVMGMTFPLHKWILMNMVFDKGGIPKVVANTPKFTISQEERILIDTEGNEIDMYREQNKMTAAIDKTAALTTFEVTLPMTEDVEIVHDKLGGLAGVDHLSIATKVCAVLVEGVQFEVGDFLPDETGFITNKSVVAEEAATKDVWVPVDYTPVPGYHGQDFDRAAMKRFAYKHKVSEGGEVTEKITTDTISIGMKKDRLTIQALNGNVKKVMVQSRLDTSNARRTTCGAKWDSHTIMEEIEPAIPINITISPEEVKDISALYNVNQVTKIMHLIKTILANYKDDKIKMHLDDSYTRLPADQKTYNTFDFAPRVGYDSDHVNWRFATFFDFLNGECQDLLYVLNDPNMTFTVYGDPDLVRMITPDANACSYQSPANIGPVELDFEKTVYMANKRLFNFIGSDKLRRTSQFILILCPNHTQRILYRIYDYQMYMSNEIRNADNPALPAIHAFERWKFVEYTPVQGRIDIENPRGINKDTYNAFPVQLVKQ